MKLGGSVVGNAAFVGAAVIAAAVSLAPAVPAAAGDEGVLSAQARATNTVNIERGRSDRFDIRVSRWSTEAEREALASALRQGGDAGLAEALASQESVGWVAFDPRGGSNPGRDPRKSKVRYAAESVDGGTREIILVTEAHVGYGDYPRTVTGARLEPDMVSVVVLKLDDSDDGRRGTGRLLVGTTIDFDAETGRAVVADTAAEPIELQDVRAR